jgi:putative PIN family toxin of toxin-antitoxin system
MNVVIDTNVFLSSFLSSRGSPRKIIDRWKRGDIAWCLCAEILEEYGDVLARFGLSESPEFAQLRELFKARRHIVWAVIANELRFIECALSTGAAYLVSGDRHLRVLERYQGIRIVSPAEFLRRIDA